MDRYLIVGHNHRAVYKGVWLWHIKAVRATWRNCRYYYYLALSPLFGNIVTKHLAAALRNLSDIIVRQMALPEIELLVCKKYIIKIECISESIKCKSKRTSLRNMIYL